MQLRLNALLLACAAVLLASPARAGEPAVGKGGMHRCPAVGPPAQLPHTGGPVLDGSPNVFVCGTPTARVGDRASCNGPPDTIVSGSNTVLINGKPAAHLRSRTAHGGSLISGCNTVRVGP